MVKFHCGFVRPLVLPLTAKSNTGKSSRKRAPRSSSRRNERSTGDVPLPIKYSQNTSSCAVPRPMTIFVARSITVANSNITASNSALVSGSYNFAFSDLDNATAFAGLFDQYRIDAVRLILRPTSNAIGLVTNSTTSVVPLYLVIDYDNATALTSVVQARSYDNCMILGPGESCCRTFRPHLALASFTGAAFNGFANDEPQWLDTVSTTIQHYGIKYVVPQVTAAQTLLQSWIVEREYFLSFRKITSGN